MSTRNYWFKSYTGTTWQEFLSAGATVSGFRERHWKSVQQMKPGDYFLCYVTGIKRWIGILEVTSEGFWDSAPVWKDMELPCRIKVKPIFTLTPETAVPIEDLRNQLSIFSPTNPNAWIGHVRSSPRKWNQRDAEIVVEAVSEATKNPVIRGLDEKDLKRKPSVS